MVERSNDFDVIVVGSGFGGSVAALRLSDAGQSVLVLERGRRWRPGEFPRDVSDVNRLLWRWPAHGNARGLYDVRFFSALAAAVASGVGGGSLIYANIHIRPDAVIFEDPRWPDQITRATLDPYYDRVRDMLGLAPLPPALWLPKRDRFRAAATAIGREVFDPDQAVSWTDPETPGREPCQLVAECEFGCQHGAKNTLDLTYLAKAERNGAKVMPDMAVESVAPADSGYRVSVRETATGARMSLSARRVVLSAGTLGTNEILLRSRAGGALPRLSERLGIGYSGNGDFLGSIANSEFDLEPWNGPDVTSVIRFFDAAPEFTMAAPTFNRGVMTFLARMGQRDPKWLRWANSFLWRQLPWLVPLVFRSGLLNRARGAAPPDDYAARRLTNLFAIGRDNANGTIRLRNERLDIDWKYADENGALVERMQQAMQSIARAYGGSYAPLVTWQLFRRIITVHSLGGCHLSESPDRGVVSPAGEVHGYPDLFVADGSVIPTSIGFHPCMTIAAVAERIADGISQRSKR
jgi:cholesterol oxidase